MRLLRDDILKLWPKRTTLETVLRDAANQNGGALTQKDATKIAQECGVYTNRGELRAELESLGLKGKQGRKRNTP